MGGSIQRRLPCSIPIHLEQDQIKNRAKPCFCNSIAKYKNTLHHFYPQLITYAVVLFKIDGELGDHDRVLHVHLDPLQALDALLAGVPGQGQLVNPNGQIL